MRTRFYILWISLAASFGWGSWILVVTRLTPFSAGYLALILFYTSLFLALSSTFALLIYYWRAWFSHEIKYQQYFNTALRQGVLLSFMINTGLVFQRLRVLTWWDALLLLAIVVLTEFYMLVRE